MTGTRTKYWLFTSYKDDLPNYSEEHIQYMVFQRERCPTTGREHWQGYVEFYRRYRLSRVVGLLGVGTHAEARRGTQQQAIDYCTKVESRISDPIHYGTPSGDSQGKRNDLEKLKETIDRGADLLDIYESNFSASAKYYKFIDRYRNLVIQRDTIPQWRIMTVIVYYGDTGTGKTRRCYEEEPNLFKLPMGDQNQVWFDGYDYQTTLLLDEFYSQLKFNFLLQLLDGHPLRVPVKHGHIMAGWNKVYITSQYHPNNWYLNIDLQLKQHLYRRINIIEEIVKSSNDLPVNQSELDINQTITLL